MKPKSWFEEKIDTLRQGFHFRFEEYLLHFSNQAAQIMEAKGLTRTELAKKMGVSKPYVTELLSGKPNLTLASMLKLVDALGSELSISIADPVLSTLQELDFSQAQEAPLSTTTVTVSEFLERVQGFESSKSATIKNYVPLQGDSLETSSLAA